MYNKPNFFYRYGEVSTNTIWDKPSWNLVNSWWKSYSSSHDFKQYSVHIGGKFVIDPLKTEDVDIIITGPILDYKHLYNLFKDGLELGLKKYNFYVDMCWYDSLDFFKYPRQKDFIRYHNLVRMSGQEYKVINGVCVNDLYHSTYDSNLKIPKYISFNRVELPMLKQINDGRVYEPIKLH